MEQTKSKWPMRLWDKGTVADSMVDDFTAGMDRILDQRMLVWEIAGSMAHVIMLYESGIITGDEKKTLLEALNAIFCREKEGNTDYERGFEDIHSMVEADLVNMAGNTGKKIHAGRSRNDQVLVDLSLWLRHEIALIVRESSGLLEKLLFYGRRYSGIMMPGHTHLQPAMPSTFGLWFASFAESLGEDLVELAGAYSVVNVSPAGTAAGYGTTLPLRRKVAASLLGFQRMVLTAPYAQLRRGKTTKCVADAIASLAFSLNRLAGDVILFLSREFSFMSLQDSFATGSSIMPQKKNPDVFEMIRARSGHILSLPGAITMMTINLPTGYNRDYQVLKEVLFPATEEIRSLIMMTSYMLDGLIINERIMADRYNDVYAAEEANRLVLKGVPFRDAYYEVASEIGRKSFTPTVLSEYSHLGSPGNPGFDEIHEFAIQVSRSIVPEAAGVLISRLKES